MFNELSDVVAQASTWAYIVLALVAMLDAILPIVPSETAVITAGVLASTGDLVLPLVIGCAAAGAFLGDNAVYLLGRRFGDRARRRFLAGPRGAASYDWARRQLAMRGGELIVVGRFIPGGRTAVSLTAGATGFAWPRFIRCDVLAAFIWAAYAALLGYFGGKSFEHSPWKGLLLALAVALAVTVGGEAVRAHLRRRRAAKARSNG